MGCVSSSSEGNLQDFMHEHSLLVDLEVEDKIEIPLNDYLENQMVLDERLQEKIQQLHQISNQSTKDQSELLKEINFEQLIQLLSRKYHLDLLMDLKQIKRFDIKTLEIVFSTLYSDLISQKHKQVNRMEINIKQCKIQISQSMLSVLIATLKFTIENYSIEHGNALFTRLQSFSKNLSGFLKTKYPRGINVDPGKLSQHFKEFDSTDEFEHDVIANTKVVFKASDRYEITNSIKIMLNKIMDQVDRKYEDFCELFGQIEQQIDQSFKVSRKISQNTARCTKMDTGIVELNSIQIARVLVKWLDSLQNILKKPQEIVNYKYQIKGINDSQLQNYLTIREVNHKEERTGQKKNQINYVEYPKQEFQKLISQGKLMKLLKQGYQKYQKQISMEESQKYKKYFKEFTTLILANLQHASLNQRQISNLEMQIIKYSYEVSNLISWIIEQKLITIIKILIGISQQLEIPGLVPNIIKFKVNDLMRCHLSGSQKSIKKAYEKILQMQAKGSIDIIKIKNRFHTDNHDAMIFFKMKGSFLLCECQLALSNDQIKNDERIKSIYDLNHFLYELQRSPFGILGQLSIFLKTQSHTVTSYYNQLKIKTTDERVKRIKKCYAHKLAKQGSDKPKIEPLSQQTPEKAREKIRIKVEKPFVCSICLKYFQNYSILQRQIFICSKCGISICWNCEHNKLKQNKNISSVAGNKQSKTNQIFIDLSQLFKQRSDHSNLFKMEEIFQQLPEDLLLRNAEKQSLNQNSPNINQTSEIRYNLNLAQAKIQKQKQVEIWKQRKIKAEQLMNYFQKTQSEAIAKRWKIHFVIFQKTQIRQDLILYRYNSFQNIIENVYSPIERYLKHQQINLSQNSKIFIFKEVFRTKVSKKQNSNQLIQIKKVNSDENQKSEKLVNGKQNPGKKIDNIKHILDSCDLPFNYQQSLGIKSLIKPQTHQFYYIDHKYSKDNKIQSDYYLIDAEFPQANGQKNCLKKQIEKLPKIKSLKKQIDLSNLGADSEQLKMLNKLSKAFEQNKPKQQAVQNPFEWMTKIKILDLSKNALTDIRILSQICPNLQRLNISDNEIKELSFQSQFASLRQIKAQDNFISKVSNFQKFKNIQNLNLPQNRIAEFKPDYHCPKLKEIDLSDNKIDKQFDFSNFGSLKILNLQDNVIGIFEYSKYPISLQILNLEDNQIVQVNNIQYLKCLQILNLQKNQITKFEILKNQSSLHCIKLSQNPIKTLSLKGAEHLKQVYLDKTNLTDQQLTSNIQNLSKLQVLSIKSNMLTKIPDFSEFLKNKTLKKISLANNPILYGIDNKYAKKIPQLYQEAKMFELVQKVFVQKVQKVLQKINPILQEENKKFQQAKQKEQEKKNIEQEVNKLFEDAKQQEDKAKQHQEKAAKLQQQETKIYAQGIQADEEVSLLLSEAKMEGNTTQQKNADATKEESTIKLEVKECKQENNEQKLGQEEAKKMQEQQKKRDKQQIQRLKEKLKKYQTKQQLRAKAAQFEQKAKKIIQNAGKLQEKTKILQEEVEKLQEEGNKIQEDRKKQEARIKQEQRKQAQFFEIVSQTLEEIVKKLQLQEEKIKRKQKFQEDAKHIDQLLQGNIEFCLPVEESYLFEKETYYFQQLSEMNEKFIKNSLRYQFFVWNSDYKKDKKRQNYYEKKPQTRKTDFIESTKQTSKKQRQLQVSYSGNEIYMKKIIKQWSANDYRESSSQAGYYRLLQRKSVMDFNVFFMFDWSKLIFVDFFDCSIDDTQWRLFVDNAESKLPHLVEIEIERNNIKTVKVSDLQKFKNLKGIRFYHSYYDYEDDLVQFMNPLSHDSISEIKIYRQNNPNCRIVYD